jgi:glycosyltransferase involved in cell wall biosynthesis
MLDKINLRFSIVIPACNGERYLKLSIESALNQTRHADEIVVVDDASTDGTAAICYPYELAGRIKYFFNERSTGFVDAWNRAVAKASGDFVTILHQDDLFHQEYIETMENALISNPQVRHLYTGCNYIDEGGKLIRTTPPPHSRQPILYSGREYAHNYFRSAIQNEPIHRCPGVMTSRTLLINLCTYRKEAGHIADVDFFYRVGGFTDVIGISQPLASFREHPHSETGKLVSLAQRVARDYVFQARYHKQNETLLGPEDITQLNRKTIWFISLLLFQSLLYKKEEWMEEAFRLREELEVVLPSFTENNLPLWARKMWKMAKVKQRNLGTTLYVNVLHMVLKARNAIRALRITQRNLFLLKNFFGSNSRSPV